MDEERMATIERSLAAIHAKLDRLTAGTALAVGILSDMAIEGLNEKETEAFRGPDSLQGLMETGQNFIDVTIAGEN